LIGIGEEENKLGVLAATSNWRRKPSESHAHFDRSDNGLAINAKLFGNFVVAGITRAVFLAVDQNSHQHEPVNDADAVIVCDTAKPIEAFEFGGAHDRTSAILA
jgi:hypothetical protein